MAKGRNSRHLRRVKTAARIALTNAAHDVRARLTTVPRSMSGYAKRNPIKTMTLSVLAGVALAQLLRLVNHK